MREGAVENIKVKPIMLLNQKQHSLFYSFN